MLTKEQQFIKEKIFQLVESDFSGDINGTISVVSLTENTLTVP